jgi:hypothetical protein
VNGDGRSGTSIWTISPKQKLPLRSLNPKTIFFEKLETSPPCIKSQGRTAPSSMLKQWFEKRHGEIIAAALA